MTEIDITQVALLGEAVECLHGVAVFVWDDDRNYVAVNDTACKLIGRTRQELLGMHVGDMTPNRASPLFDEVVRRGGPHTGIHRFDGGELHFVTTQTRIAGLPYWVSVLLERHVSERWEEGFDTWSPRDLTPADGDTGIDVDRDELMRLARELASQRHADQEQSRDELDRLKESLRERAAAVAERERELAELQKHLEGGRRKKHQAQAPAPAAATDALAARERAALERLQAVEARERELEARAAELETEAARVAERESALAAELAAAREELSQSEADRQLAAAERERLEERLEEARRAEKELAAMRLELERERVSIEAREREVAARAAAVSEDTQPDPYEERERELRRLEARLEARERELALQRQGLDAQRNELHDRERTVRRREVVEVRQAFGPPLAPPRFGEGLAAFVSSRSRR